MKFLATVLIMLWSWPVFSFSLTEFAAEENAGKPEGFIYWHGEGTMATAPRGRKDSFLISLTMRNLGNHAILFQHRVMFDTYERHPHFVAQVEDNGFFSIYVPNEERESAVAEHEVVDLTAYHKSGWGYSVGSSMYLDYKAGNGHYGLQHYRSYTDEHGNFRLASTGSMGTEAEGLKFTWMEDFKRVFVHRPH